MVGSAVGSGATVASLVGSAVVAVASTAAVGEATSGAAVGDSTVAASSGTAARQPTMTRSNKPTKRYTICFFIMIISVNRDQAARITQIVQMKIEGIRVRPRPNLLLIDLNLI
jgi:hypothetical protein